MRSRHIPAAVKRAVALRDAGRCAFAGQAGRCVERGALEFHHVVPYAEGGKATAENIQLRCRAHNQYEAEQWFGPLMVRELGPGPSSQWHGIRANAPRWNGDSLQGRDRETGRRAGPQNRVLGSHSITRG